MDGVNISIGKLRIKR